MSRLVALVCLVLALLCPVVCLAETAGEGTASCGEVCEAMAVGAVVTDLSEGLASHHHLPLSMDGLVPFAPTSSASLLGLPCTEYNPRTQIPPRKASQRQSLLQSFLF